LITLGNHVKPAVNARFITLDSGRSRRQRLATVSNQKRVGETESNYRCR
jgi:hypothetical protein